MKKDVNVFLFNDECYVYYGDYEIIRNNWNQLKEWLQERNFVYNITGEDLDEDTSISEVLDKMCEIERRLNNV